MVEERNTRDLINDTGQTLKPRALVRERSHRLHKLPRNDRRVMNIERRIQGFFRTGIG